MMHTRHTCSDLDETSALVRALRSLRVGDAEIVDQVVNAFEGGWSVQTCDDYDGYLFILIEPSSEQAGHLASYMVSGKTGQMELAAIDGDDYQTLGCFGDIYGLTAELTSRLLSTARQSHSSAH